MTVLARLIRDDAGETAVQFALMAIVLVVIGFATASSIGANLRTH